MSQSASSQLHNDSGKVALPICQNSWERTPPVIQDDIKGLHQQIDRLRKQVSSKSPSSGSLFKKTKRKLHQSGGNLAKTLGIANRLTLL